MGHLKSAPPLLKLAHKVRVVRGSAQVRHPVFVRDAIYVGAADQDLTKLSAGSLEVIWRQPAGGFEPWTALGSVILLTSLRTMQTRGIDLDGNELWTLEKKGRWGWGLWRDRLHSTDLDGGLSFADPETGQLVEQFDIGARPGEVVYGLCGDVLLLRGKSGDPFRAFDLVRRETIWERSLLAEVAGTYDVWDDLPLMITRPGTAGRFVGFRGNGVFGFSMLDGRPLWGVRMRADSFDVHNGRVYFWTSALDVRFSRLVCLDEPTGAVLYDVTREAFVPWPVGAVSRHHIAYTSSTLGEIVVHRLVDGQELWRHSYPRGISDAPLIAGNRLFVCGSDGSFLAFEGHI